VADFAQDDSASWGVIEFSGRSGLEFDRSQKGWKSNCGSFDASSVADFAQDDSAPEDRFAGRFGYFMADDRCPRRRQDDKQA